MPLYENIRFGANDGVLLALDGFLVASQLLRVMCSAILASLVNMMLKIKPLHETPAHAHAVSARSNHAGGNNSSTSEPSGKINDLQPTRSRDEFGLLPLV